MKLDYKDWTQNRAEELANELYEMEYYDLPEQAQSTLYNQAIEDYKDHLADQIDAIYERLRMAE